MTLFLQQEEAKQKSKELKRLKGKKIMFSLVPQPSFQPKYLGLDSSGAAVSFSLFFPKHRKLMTKRPR